MRDIGGPGGYGATRWSCGVHCKEQSETMGAEPAIVSHSRRLVLRETQPAVVPSHDVDRRRLSCPLPFAGEGSMVVRQIRMGEGFFVTTHPSPIVARGSTELPSPAAEVGFIRLRPPLKVPELGQARVRVGEGAITATAFVVPSHDVKQHVSFPRRIFARGFGLLLTPNRGVGGSQDACSMSAAANLLAQTRYVVNSVVTM
jgi:hypothetical protein